MMANPVAESDDTMGECLIYEESQNCGYLRGNSRVSPR